MIHSAVVVAAGSGSRFKSNSGRPKQLEALGDRPLFLVTLDRLDSLEFQEILLVIRPQDEAEIRAHLSSYSGRFRSSVKIVFGGARRQDSVRNGLLSLLPCDRVWIHDGARPFLSDTFLRLLTSESEKRLALIPVVEVVETLKEVSSVGEVLKTLDRSRVVRVQTPQIFDYRTILSAHEEVSAGATEFTDDAAILESLGKPVFTVPGDQQNIKVTRREDLRLTADMDIRVGQGFDVHELVEGRKLILGGIEVPHARGLAGHSDADALIHAIVDAILGALALGDIGHHFSPSDERFKNMSSVLFLEHCRRLCEERGARILSIDSTLILEEPKMAPFIQAMRTKMAGALGIEVSRVSVKATTTETLGFTGRKEGIAAQAVCLLSLGQATN